MQPNDNSAQIEYWNGEAGTQWAKGQQRMDTLLAPITTAVLSACSISAGDSALDIGCGCGETSLRLAERGATVLGVDISKPMLERARERAAAAGAAATFILGDAAQTRFERDRNLAFSRFGVMFFSDPTAAFENIRSALRNDGRLCFVCWQAPQLNAWISAPFAAAQPMLPPQPPLEPRAPGPFAFADPKYLHEILTGAGFSDVHVDPLATSLMLGHDVESALAIVRDVGPLSRSLGDMEPAQRAPIIAAVRDVLEANLTAAGVALGAACWIVQAAA